MSDLSFTSLSKRVLVRNQANENELDLHKNELETRFETEVKRNSKMAKKRACIV